jgi:hypothetical protein
VRGRRGIRGRRRSILTLTLKKIKEQLIDWFGRRQVTIDRDLHIYIGGWTKPLPRIGES